MEERNENLLEAQPLAEVVETYRHPRPQEVVMTYARPLPQGHPAAAAAAAVRAPKRKRMPGKSGLWLFLVCFVLLVMLVAAAGLLYEVINSRRPAGDEAAGQEDPYFREDPYFYDEEYQPSDISSEVNIPRYPYGQGAKLEVLKEHGETLTPQEVYRQVSPAVVTVMSHYRGRVFVGSGVIFTADGYVLTNYHVVQGGAKCTVMLSTGYQYEALYVAGSADHDLAVLKMETEEELPVAVFGDSDLLVVGDPAYAIGNPLSYELLGTMTDGIISAVNREVEVGGRLMTLIQTNAALNSGNSGGPLINQYGQVVGINVIKMNSPYSTIEGLGFAIPTSGMKRVVNDLLTFGEVKPEPLLGVSVRQVATEAEEGVWGLEVLELVKGGAAAKAGIREGDWLLSADGVPLKISNDLLEVRRTHYVGDRLKVVLWRDGKQMEVTLDLQEAVTE